MNEVILIAAFMTYVLNFGGWACYVAMAKNREWYEGFAAGVMLGPFGVVTMACMPTLEPKLVRAPEIADEDRFRKRYTDAEWMKRLERLPKPLAK